MDSNYYIVETIDQADAEAALFIQGFEKTMINVISSTDRTRKEKTSRRWPNDCIANLLPTYLSTYLSYLPILPTYPTYLSYLPILPTYPTYLSYLPTCLESRTGCRPTGVKTMKRVQGSD